MNFNYSDRMANMNGTATREIFKLLSRPEIVSFAGGLPATECLPIAQIKEIANEILGSDDAVKVLQYGTTEGFVPLKTQMIELLKDVDILNADANSTLIISGGQQGIDLMCKTFLNRGDVVLVENPTYLAALQILNSYEAKAVGVNSIGSDIDLEDLEKKIILHRPKFVYLVPTFSNPTGKTYSTNNRKEIARLTAKYGVMVLEDDPYSRIRFEGVGVPAIKSFDVVGNVVHLSSLSKIFAPGMRVGMAVGDVDVIRKMGICKQGTDLHTNSLAQMIAAKYIEKGYLKPNVAASLPIYLQRKAAMVEAIQKYMPEEFKSTNPQGGLFIWGEFKASVDTVKILPEAVAKNVAYIQGQVFYADNSGLNTLRLNYSNASLEKIDYGMKALGDLYKQKIAEASKGV